MDGIIGDERLAKLLQFTKALVEANQAGVYEIPLIASAVEAYAVLCELVVHRKLSPVVEADGMLKLVRLE